MFMPIVQGGHSGGALTLDITSNTSDVNILTLATAAGYNASTDDTAIIVNIASGVAITATSGNPGITTGALNAASDVTINIAATASVCGFDGAQGANGGGGANGSAGGNGTNAITFAITSGTGTYSVVNSGTIGGGSGGGGGGGGYGAATTRYGDSKGGPDYCAAPTVTGSTGAAGANGASCQAQNGSAGSSGSGGGGLCNIYGAGSGGAGGTAGKAVEFGGLSVTVTNNGTLYGATS